MKPSVLSVYLSKPGVDAPSAGELLTLFHSLVHENVTDEDKKVFRKDLLKIEEYLRQSYNSRGKRSVVFFTSGNRLWKISEFEFVLPALCLISDKPYLEPIRKGIKKHERYLVLLADREKARIFTVFLGNIEEHEDVFNMDVPQNVKAKKVDWGRDDKIFRHIEDHLHRHLQFISGKVTEFAKGKNIHFLILGGHKELLSKVRKHLHYPLNKLVRGEFVTQLNIPLSKVLLHSKKVAASLL